MAREHLISIIDIAQNHGRRKQAIHRIVRKLSLNVENVVGERTRGRRLPTSRFETTRPIEVSSIRHHAPPSSLTPQIPQLHPLSST